LIDPLTIWVFTFGAVTLSNRTTRTLKHFRHGTIQGVKLHPEYQGIAL
jgi:hypothetical protein